MESLAGDSFTSRNVKTAPITVNIPSADVNSNVCTLNLWLLWLCCVRSSSLEKDVHFLLLSGYWKPHLNIMSWGISLNVRPSVSWRGSKPNCSCKVKASTDDVIKCIYCSLIDFIPTWYSIGESLWGDHTVGDHALWGGSCNIQLFLWLSTFITPWIMGPNIQMTRESNWLNYVFGANWFWLWHGLSITVSACTLGVWICFRIVTLLCQIFNMALGLRCALLLKHWRLPKRVTDGLKCSARAIIVYRTLIPLYSCTVMHFGFVV